MLRGSWLFVAVVLLAVAPAWSADFVVHGDQPIIDSFQGFGSHCNAWLYCKPNWGTISTNQNIAQLENLFVDLAPQQMRIFVEIQPDSPQQSDPAVKASVIKTIQLARRAGATVNCTLWHGPYNCLGDNAQQMVDMLVDFIRVQGLTNIKYVTLQNEPNEFGFDTGRWTTLYREVDLRLRFAGLRDQIKIIGGDLVGEKQDIWLNVLQNDLADVCDGYSVHMYCPYWNRQLFDARIPGIIDITSKFPKEAQRPLYITEFGFRGHATGDVEPGHDDNGTNISDTPAYGILYGCRQVDALNHGFVAMLEWDGFDSSYARSIMPYGPIGWHNGTWYKRPYYHLMRLFTHTAKVGWRTLKVDGPRDDVLLTAIESTTGDFTLYAANRSSTPQVVNMQGTPTKQLNAWLWNADGRGTVTSSAPIDARKGKITITLPPMSVMAATTLQFEQEKP